MTAHVSVSVHPDPAAFRTVEFPESGGGPFVSLQLGGGASLLINDPATLTALADLVASARTWLAATVAGQAMLPLADPEPVGDTGLTLHPLPVGGGVMAGSGLRTAQVRWELVSGLRRWAEGSVTDEAAVELLASWSAGCLIRPGVTWVQPCKAPGFVALDGDALNVYAATRSGDEQRVLLLAASLLKGVPLPRRRVRSRRAVA